MEVNLNTNTQIANEEITKVGVSVNATSGDLTMGAGWEKNSQKGGEKVTANVIYDNFSAGGSYDTEKGNPEATAAYTIKNGDAQYQIEGKLNSEGQEVGLKMSAPIGKTPPKAEQPKEIIITTTERRNEFSILKLDGIQYNPVKITFTEPTEIHSSGESFTAVAGDTFLGNETKDGKVVHGKIIRNGVTIKTF